MRRGQELGQPFHYPLASAVRVAYRTSMISRVKGKATNPWTRSDAIIHPCQPELELMWAEAIVFGARRGLEPRSLGPTGENSLSTH
jgi:hypothetical protein